MNVKQHWVELDSNSIYKAKSHKIKPEHKKSVNVYYHRISLEDMFVDVECNGKYILKKIMQKVRLNILKLEGKQKILQIIV